MSSIDNMKEKLNNFEVKKSWQWLLYMYLVLPGLMFVIAYIGGDSAIGTYFSKIFHSYNLYAINPIPHITSLTGIIGLIIPLYLMWKAFRRKDYKDLIITAILFVGIAVFFYFEVNYVLLKLLKFGGEVAL